MRYRSLLAALCVGFLPGAAFGAEFRVLSSWDQRYPVVPMFLEYLLNNVQKASNGDMKFVMSGPETVPPFQQLQPVSSGVFQILLTHGAYHTGETPYLMALEALSGDLKKWRDAGVREMVDKHYERRNLKLIALAQTPEKSALQMIVRQPIGQSGDLQGRKMRGTVAHSGVLQLLGASPVVLPPADIYSSLDKGVVDGFVWPVIGVSDYRWYEVAKYQVKPTFGLLVYPIFFNLAAWNKLTDQEKKIFLEEGRKAEDRFYVEWTKLADGEATKLKEHGMQTTEVGQDKRQKMDKALNDALFEIGLKANAKDVGELRDFAKSQGLY